MWVGSYAVRWTLEYKVVNPGYEGGPGDPPLGCEQSKASSVVGLQYMHLIEGVVIYRDVLFWFVCLIRGVICSFT